MRSIAYESLFRGFGETVYRVCVKALYRESIHRRNAVACVAAVCVSRTCCSECVLVLVCYRLEDSHCVRNSYLRVAVCVADEGDCGCAALSCGGYGSSRACGACCRCCRGSRACSGRCRCGGGRSRSLARVVVLIDHSYRVVGHGHVIAARAVCGGLPPVLEFDVCVIICGILYL